LLLMNMVYMMEIDGQWRLQIMTLKEWNYLSLKRWENPKKTIAINWRHFIFHWWP
jgi:hypothetical protein